MKNVAIKQTGKTLNNVLQAMAAYIVRIGRKNDCLSFCGQYLKYGGNMLAEALERAQAAEDYHRHATGCLERQASKMAVFIDRKGLTDEYNDYALRSCRNDHKRS